MGSVFGVGSVTEADFRERLVEIGGRLRYLRITRGMSLARVMDEAFGETHIAAPSKLSAWESGARSPLLWRLFGLMDFYGQEHLQYVLTGQQLRSVTEDEMTQALYFLNNVQKMLNIESAGKRAAGSVFKIHEEDVDGILSGVRERMKEARQLKGMTQDMVAAELGVRHETVYHWENDTKRLPLDVVLSCAALYRVNVTWLITGEGMPEIEER